MKQRRWRKKNQPTIEWMKDIKQTPKQQAFINRERNKHTHKYIHTNSLKKKQTNRITSNTHTKHMNGWLTKMNSVEIQVKIRFCFEGKKTEKEKKIILQTSKQKKLNCNKMSAKSILPNQKEKQIITSMTFF